MAAPAFAVPGDLDTSFHHTGKVETNFGSPNDTARGVALQADGKIVTAGSLAPGISPSKITVARYKSKGKLDLFFSSDGMFTLALGVGDSYAADVAIQADGRIVLAGAADAGGHARQDFAVVRLDSVGTLDSTFGGGTGYVLTNFGGDDAASSVVIQADGKILVGGRTSLHSDDFALARYNVDGTLDTTFGGTGRVITQFLFGFTDYINDITLQADGKIVAVGEVRTPYGPDFAIARYKPNGKLDKTFNGTGKVQVDFDDPAEEALSVAVQPADGDIAVGGPVVNDQYGDLDFGLTRLTATGAIDETFGYQGKVVTDFFNHSDDHFGALTLQTDGKIVAGGGTGVTRETPLNFGLARYLPNGALDPMFGYEGVVATDFGGSDMALDLVLQADGKIVTAGTGGARGDFALARYLAS
jgi:uncharacterized delta-60 repeat protein